MAPNELQIESTIQPLAPLLNGSNWAGAKKAAFLPDSRRSALARDGSAATA